jgi:membrane fusion protein, heavy metal efflux system
MNCPVKLTIAVLAIALLAGCSAQSQTSSQPVERPTTVTLSEKSKAYLEIATVTPQGAELGIVLPGRVAFRPQGLAAVGTPVSARVVSVNVRPGELVKAGAPLLTLQSAEAAGAKADVDQANAKVTAAEDILRRQNLMIEKGVGLEVERFSAEISLREAKAELERARKAATIIGVSGGDRFVVRAPNTGVVMAVRANIGAVVVPGGDALVEIGDPNRLWVIADIPESDAGSAAIGRNAQVRIPSIDRQFEATVDGVGQLIDGDQRRLPVYLSLKDSTQKLTPGMLAEIRLRSTDDKSMTLPVTAVLIKDGSQRVVYVEKDNGQFVPQIVRTGMSRDGRVTILEGLTPGSKVVVRGALLLDGTAEQLL